MQTFSSKPDNQITYSQKEEEEEQMSKFYKNTIREKVLPRQNHAHLLGIFGEVSLLYVARLYLSSFVDGVNQGIDI